MPQTPDAPTLQRFIETHRLGNAIGHRNLTLVPLLGGGAPALEYVLGADAIRAGTLEVTEIGESGSVPELLALSKADVMILLVDGEELIGAKQDRILNTSVLLPPRSKTKIPVSCVEQGRWQDRSRSFDVGSQAPSGLRAAKSRSVGRSLRARGQAQSDQGEVWDMVAFSLQACAANSATGAMHDAVQQRRDSLDAYVMALPCPQDARGVLVAINGRFVALDLFDKPQTLAHLWLRLVSGYAMDALVSAEANEPAGKPFSASTAKVILEHLGELPCQPCPTVGVGEDWRFEAEDLVGQALVAEGAAVHVCAFPNDPQSQRSRPGPSSIQPPSRRRRGRRGGAQDDRGVAD